MRQRPSYTEGQQLVLPGIRAAAGGGQGGGVGGGGECSTDKEESVPSGQTDSFNNIFTENLASWSLYLSGEEGQSKDILYYEAD